MISMDESYYERIKDSINPIMVRNKMLKHLSQNGFNISKTAREFNTTRKTVRKWSDRYKEKGEKGLKINLKNLTTLLIKLR